MGKWFLAFAILVVAAVGAAYLWLYKPQEEELAQARTRVTACAAELNRLQSQVADLETVREELRKTSADFQQQVAQKEQALAAVRSTQDQLVGELQREIANKQIEVERIKDKLRVEMVDEVLFDSGVAEIKPEGQAVLKKIGAVLARSHDRGIEVQGHTDNVPIRGALAHRYATNWELSAARATNVARFLQDQEAVDPGHWLWHAILPLISYGAALAVAIELLSGALGALSWLAGSEIVLTIVGIHNAWDLVLWLARNR